LSFYLDTSVLVAYYVPEALSQAAEDLLLDEPGPTLSELTEVEFLSALARKVRQQELTRQAATRVRGLFVTHLEAGYFRRLTLNRHHYSLARDWIGLFETPLRTLDALHLAAAGLAELELVTADHGLAQSAEALGLSCQLVEAAKSAAT
jgi:predicted nucleic acid-binding protein